MAEENQNVTKKGVMVSFRLTLEQFLKLKQDASSSGLKVSKYIRKKIGVEE